MSTERNLNVFARGSQGSAHIAIVYDGEGRITQVTASSGTNPVTSVTYSTSSTTNPLGSLTGVTFGSADSDTFSYDPNTGRLLTYTFSVNSQTDIGTLTWNPNGTLQKMVINDQISGTSDSQSCSYQYDDLQRLSAANCGSLWTQGFTYAVTRTYTYGRQRISENQLISGTWKPSFYGYDGHGNVRFLENTAGTVTDTYQFDAFGNLIGGWPRL